MVEVNPLPDLAAKPHLLNYPMSLSHYFHRLIQEDCRQRRWWFKGSVSSVSRVGGRADSSEIGGRDGEKVLLR